MWVTHSSNLLCFTSNWKGKVWRHPLIFKEIKLLLLWLERCTVNCCAEEMAQQLGVLAAITEDRNLLLHTHTWLFAAPCNSSFPASKDTHMHMHTHCGDIHKNKSFKIKITPWMTQNAILIYLSLLEKFWNVKTKKYKI